MFKMVRSNMVIKGDCGRNVAGFLNHLCGLELNDA
jgi:hypothetical protein